jgi:hypothetical protein
MEKPLRTLRRDRTEHLTGTSIADPLDGAAHQGMV